MSANPGPGVSPRIAALRSELLAAVAASGERTLHSRREWMDVERLRVAAHRARAGDPAVARRARAFEAIVRGRAVAVGPGDILAGSQRNFVLSSRPPDPQTAALEKERAALGIASSDGHIVPGFASALGKGFLALGREAEEGAARFPAGDPRRTTLEAMGIAARAAADVGGRYAAAADALPGTAADPYLLRLRDACRRVPALPARTFFEAVQAVWLVQCMLHWENTATAVSLGRLDQYLWPYLERDLASGALAPHAAQEIVDALWLKLCEGCESQNLVAGGVDREGRPADNPLTALCLRASTRLGTWQPSLSLRISPGTPDGVWDAAADLVRTGISMPAFFSDAAVVPALERCGLPAADARDYGIVGCYEASGSGNHYARTVSGWVNAPLAVTRALADPVEPRDFDEFLRRFFDRFGEEIAAVAGRSNDGDRFLAAEAPSPFTSLLFDGCVESGRCIEEGGARYNTSGVSLAGLATTVDSLLAVGRLVFRERRVTARRLAEILAADWENEEPLRLAARRIEGYGSGDPEAARLADRIARFFAERLLSTENTRGGRFCPGLYQFRGHFWGRTAAGATPDGRKKEDFYPYGVGPGERARTAGVTAVLAAAARLPHALCANGNALEVNLTAADLAGPRGARLVRELVAGYFGEGGSHLCINRLRVEDLRAAQERPEEHGDLLVRISGFSTRFVTLERAQQDDIILRSG